MTPEIIFLSRAELGLRDPRSISRNIDPSRGGVMGHWGGGPQRITTLDAAVARWQAWQWQHMAPGGLGTQNGAVDVGYNLGFWDKYVFAGRGQGVRSGANGTNDANFRFVSAVWIGGSGETPTDQDKFTFVHIVKMLRDNGAGLEVKPHSLVRPTACPGDDWRRFIAPLDGNKDIIDEPIKPAPEPTPPRPPRPRPPQPTWTETLVNNLPTRQRRTNLSTEDRFDGRIQGLLAEAGVLDVDTNTVRRGGVRRFDRKFGPSTDQAVRRFQRGANITVDGIVGPQTWTKLLGR